MDKHARRIRENSAGVSRVKKVNKVYVREWKKILNKLAMVLLTISVANSVVSEIKDFQQKYQDGKTISSEFPDFRLEFQKYIESRPSNSLDKVNVDYDTIKLASYVLEAPE